SVSSARTSGSAVSVTIPCSGGAAGQSCTGSITLTSHVTTQGTKVIAITAAKKKVTKVVTVGAGSYSVPAGGHATITLKLNKTGLKLLQTKYKLPATMRLTGTTNLTKTITFSYARIKAPIAFAWSFNSSF